MYRDQISGRVSRPLDQCRCVHNNLTRFSRLFTNQFLNRVSRSTKAAQHHQNSTASLEITTTRCFQVFILFFKKTTVTLFNFAQSSLTWSNSLRHSHQTSLPGCCTGSPAPLFLIRNEGYRHVDKARRDGSPGGCNNDHWRRAKPHHAVWSSH